VKVYPNPANEQVTITTEQKNNYNIVITDVIGKVVFKSTLINKLEIQVKDWQAGFYYVQVISENGYKEVQKLIIE